jgi:hypothetical protein
MIKKKISRTFKYYFKDVLSNLFIYNYVAKPEQFKLFLSIRRKTHISYNPLRSVILYKGKTNQPIFKYKYIASILAKYIYSIYKQLKLYSYFLNKMKELLIDEEYIKVREQNVYHHKHKYYLFAKYKFTKYILYRYWFKKRIKKKRRKVWLKFYRAPFTFWGKLMKRRIRSYLYNFFKRIKNYKHLFYKNYEQIAYSIYKYILKRKRAKKRLNKRMKMYPMSIHASDHINYIYKKKHFNMLFPFNNLLKKNNQIKDIYNNSEFYLLNYFYYFIPYAINSYSFTLFLKNYSFYLYLKNNKKYEFFLMLFYNKLFKYIIENKYLLLNKKWVRTGVLTQTRQFSKLNQTLPYLNFTRWINKFLKFHILKGNLNIYSILKYKILQKYKNLIFKYYLNIKYKNLIFLKKTKIINNKYTFIKNSFIFNINKIKYKRKKNIWRKKYKWYYKNKIYFYPYKYIFKRGLKFKYKKKIQKKYKSKRLELFSRHLKYKYNKKKKIYSDNNKIYCFHSKKRKYHIHQKDNTFFSFNKYIKLYLLKKKKRHPLRLYRRELRRRIKYKKYVPFNKRNYFKRHLKKIKKKYKNDMYKNKILHLKKMYIYKLIKRKKLLKYKYKKKSKKNKYLYKKKLKKKIKLLIYNKKKNINIKKKKLKLIQFLYKKKLKKQIKHYINYFRINKKNKIYNLKKKKTYIKLSGIKKIIKFVTYFNRKKYKKKYIIKYNNFPIIYNELLNNFLLRLRITLKNIERNKIKSKAKDFINIRNDILKESIVFYPNYFYNITKIYYLVSNILIISAYYKNMYPKMLKPYYYWITKELSASYFLPFIRYWKEHNINYYNYKKYEIIQKN